MSAQNFFGGMLQGLLGGFAQGKLQQDERKYQEKLTSQKNILDFFQKLMSRPDLTPEARKWALQGLQAASQGDFGSAKKLMEAVNLLGQGPQPIKTVGTGAPATISALNKEGKVDPDRMTAAGLIPGLGNLPVPRGGMPEEEVPTLDKIIPYSQEGITVNPDYLAEQDLERNLRYQQGIQDLTLPGKIAVEREKALGDIYQQQAKEVGEQSKKQRALEWIKANPNATPEEVFVQTGYRPPAPGQTEIKTFMLEGKSIEAQVTPQGRVIYKGEDVTDKVNTYRTPQREPIIVDLTGGKMSDADVVENYGRMVVSGHRPMTSVPQKYAPAVEQWINQNAMAVLNAPQRTQLTEIEQAKNSVLEIFDNVAKTNFAEGPAAVLNGLLQSLAGRMQLDVEAEMAKGARAFTRKIARALGEKGVITEGDITDFEIALMRLGEGKKLTAAKFKRLTDLFDKNRMSIITEANAMYSLTGSRVGEPKAEKSEAEKPKVEKPKAKLSPEAEAYMKSLGL